MNRRGFLVALALTPVAAVIAPAGPRPTFATGGYTKPKYGYLGDRGGEFIVPNVMSAEQARRMAKTMQIVSQRELYLDELRRA